MTNIVAGLLMALLAAEGTATVTGTWNMGLQGDHVIPTPLVLKQDGAAVTGTIGMPTHRAGERIEVKLAGGFEKGVLTLSGEVEGAGQPTRIEISGTLQPDGTLEGKLLMASRSIPWTAERLREPKQE